MAVPFNAVTQTLKGFVLVGGLVLDVGSIMNKLDRLASVLLGVAVVLTAITNLMQYRSIQKLEQRVEVLERSLSEQNKQDQRLHRV